MKEIKALISGQLNRDSGIQVVTIKDVDCSIAYHGLEDIEAEVDLIQNWMMLHKEDLDSYSVCIGGVNDCRWALNKMGVVNYDISCYPDSLKMFMGRAVEIMPLQAFIKHVGHYYENGHRFVKPVKPKRFSAFLTSDANALDMLYGVDQDTEVYVSEIVNLKSEWRVYVKLNNIVRMCHYSGNPLIFPDPTAVKYMIDSWEGPCCYTLDVGIVGNRAVLVEINDFYSIGNYGLFPREYVEMLILRWAQLTGKDPFQRR